MCYMIIVIYYNLKIPTGIQLRNENKLDEMCTIRSELQKYCPIIPVLESENSSANTQHNYKCSEVLFGGDQLTRAQIISAICK